MAVQVTLTIPDELYAQAQQFAAQHQQDVSEVLSAAITLSPTFDVDLDPQMTHARLAYQKLYPHLKEQFLGQYVAVLDGELIDHDHGYGELVERIEEQFGERFVWITRVGEESIETIYMRSPRLEAI